MITTKPPTATDLLWAVFHPSQEQRRLLAALPATSNAVLVATASAAVLKDEGTVEVVGPTQTSVLVYSHYVAHALGLSEATVKGHLRNLQAKGLVTGRAVGNGFTGYAANGSVILATLADRRVVGQPITSASAAAAELEYRKERAASQNTAIGAFREFHRAYND